MGKRILFTEQQLRKIIGEDAFVTYLDKSDHGEDKTVGSIPMNGEEVMEKPNIENAVPETEDDFAHKTVATHPWMRRGYNTLYEERKKKLNERTKVDGMTFNIGQQTRNAISQLGSNSEMVKNILDPKSKTNNIDTMNMRGRRLKELKKTNPAEYQAKGGKALEKAIDSTVKRARQTGKALNDANKSTQDLTQMPQARGNGKGHRKNVAQNIYYETNN